MLQSNRHVAAPRGRQARRDEVIRAAAICACEVLEARRLLAAAVPELVKEINTNTQGSDLFLPGTAMGGAVFFSTSDPTAGRELWRSDGTAAGTLRVADIAPGAAGSDPGWVTAIGGALYFAASDPAAGRELWRSDGTAIGTVRVKDINPGAGGSSPGFLTDVNGTLMFLARDANGDHDLWKSDGTTAGTVMVADLGDEDEHYYYSPSHEVATAGGTLYFTASHPAGGGELWRSDGTSAGTGRLADLNPGPGGSYPSELTAVGNTLYFFAAADTHGADRELWRTDGTATGTVRVKDINPGADGSSPRQLTAVGDTLYFIASDDASGAELWRSDGTDAGTLRVADLREGPEGSDLRKLTAAGNTLYFVASDDAAGRELWRSDGTAAGTARVKDIQPGPNLPFKLTAVGNTLYFGAHDPVGGWELWRSDGTDAGTARVADIVPGPLGSIDPPGEDWGWGDVGGMTFLDNGTVFFVADDGAHGRELWKTDGTAAGTVMVVDLNTASAGSDPGFGSGFIDFKGKLYFETRVLGGYELWQSDGTAAGTVRVMALGGVPTGLTVVGNTLYFTASDATTGEELWRTDGTAGGTFRVRDINPGPDSSFPYELTAVGGTLYFTARDGNRDRELWRSDGTAAGTVRVKDIYPWGSSLLGNLTAVGNNLFFSAYDYAGLELWRSDGTAAGTVRVTDLNPSSGDSYPRSGSFPTELTVIGNTLYFITHDAIRGRALWRTDGTAPGTVRLMDAKGWPNNFLLGELTVVGPSLFFRGYDPAGGWELWRSDGTAAGTVRVIDIVPSAAGWVPTQLTAAGSTLYFAAGDADGRGLWRSDGTAAGTVRVADVVPATDVIPFKLAAVDGTLYFAAVDSAAGLELWRSDGTAAGTVRVADLNPGPAWSSPRFLTVVNDTLYFSAANPTGNQELWKLDLTAPPAATVVGRHVFYNNSFFDGDDPAANGADDGAVATDKSALLPGQSPSFANLTSFSRGLNGIMLDVAGLPPDAVLTADDFTFRTGRSADPAAFVAGPAPVAVTVRRGAGVGGSDRVILTWRDHSRTHCPAASQAVANGWLEVTVKANPSTCLAAPDVFYFGNLVGETGDQPHRAVTVADFLQTRHHFARAAGVTSPFDHDRDGRVSGTDLAAVLANMRGSMTDVRTSPRRRGPLADEATAVLADR